MEKMRRKMYSRLSCRPTTKGGRKEGVSNHGDAPAVAHPVQTKLSERLVLHLNLMYSYGGYQTAKRLWCNVWGEVTDIQICSRSIKAMKYKVRGRWTNADTWVPWDQVFIRWENWTPVNSVMWLLYHFSSERFADHQLAFRGPGTRNTLLYPRYPPCTQVPSLLYPGTLPAVPSVH